MRTLSKILCITSILFCGQVAAGSIGWGSSPSPIYVNDVFTVDIIGSGFTTNVDGGGIDFLYDSSILNVQSVSIDSVWDPLLSSPGTTNNGAGTVDELYVNTFGSVTGDFVVATVTFGAVGLGTSVLGLSEYMMNPWASGGSLLNPDFLNGLLTVTNAPAAVVPIPAAVWLFGSGLLGLIGMTRRKVV